MYKIKNIDTDRSKIVTGGILYFLILSALIMLIPEHYLDINNHKFILTLGFIGMWRYIWAFIHLGRATVYMKKDFPALRKKADEYGETNKVPHLYFLVTSYRMEPETILKSYTNIFKECVAYNTPATVLASVTDPAEEDLIEQILRNTENNGNIELVLMTQAGTGKRDAMSAILLAIARRNPPPDSLIVFMDGDTLIPENMLSRLLPFFSTVPDLGALTTDERAYVSNSEWGNEWFDMRFAQRHIYMSSLSKSRKVLTLTGRLSVFRADLATDPSFISMLQNDYINHWRLGRLKFLTGDDKSTWFWLLKNRYRMLYVPDVQIQCIESLPGKNFFDSTIKLMVRWFGNMMRNNGRSIALGPKRMGFFVWWCLIDQRLSIWTTMTGPLFSLFLAIHSSPVYLIIYLIWILFTRMLQSVTPFVVRKRFTPYFPLLLYYTQIVGSIVKIYISFRPDKQKWTRQGVRIISSESKLKQLYKRYSSRYITSLSVMCFCFFLGVKAELFRMPELTDYTALKSSITASAASNRDLSQLLRSAPPHSVIRLDKAVYRLKSPLLIDKPVTIKGKGVDSTVIEASFSGVDRGIIEIRGENPGRIPGKRWKRALNSISAEDLSVSLNPGHGIRAGDTVIIRNRNNREILKYLGATRWNRKYPYLRYLLIKVIDSDERNIFFSNSAGIDIGEGAEIAATSSLKNVRLSNLTIKYRSSDQPNASIYKNLKPEAGIDGILCLNTVSTAISDVRIINAGRHPVNLDTCFSPVLLNVYMSGAWNKGKGGNGYFRIARTSRGEFRNITVLGLRHITFQWTSNNNTLFNLDSDTDINFHGGNSQKNTVWVKSLKIRPSHPWPEVYRTPVDATWAPPDGEDNRVIYKTSKTKGTKLNGTEEQN